MVQLFKTNITKNILEEVSEYQNQYQIASNPVYVKGVGSYGTIYRATITNPDGSSERPFETVNEAINYINNHPYIDHANINLLAGNRFSATFATNKGVVVRSSTTTPVTLGGVTVYGSGQVGLLYLDVWNSNPNIGGYTAPIRCYNSKLNIRSVETHTTATDNYTATESGLYCAQGSIVNCHGSEFATGTGGSATRYGRDGTLLFIWTDTDDIYLNHRALISGV